MYVNLAEKLTQFISELNELSIINLQLPTQDMLCCAGIPRQMPFFDLSRRRTMAGDLVSVQRSHGGYIYADRLT